ncbi:MAG: CBS domain-containing protein, partial [Blastocatellia bacterium]
VIQSREQIYSISNQATVAEAARYLKERRIRAVGVCNLMGKIVGVVSQSDISDKVVAENFRPAEVAVQQIASTRLFKVTPETDCKDAAHIMNENGIYHLIVEDETGRFLGMISLRDCTTMKAEEASERAAFFEAYAFPRY